MFVLLHIFEPVSYKEWTHVHQLPLLTKGSNTAKIQEISFSTQTITHINQYILQKYAIKQTYHLLDEVSTSYVQDKHSTSMHKQRLKAVLLY